MGWNDRLMHQHPIVTTPACLEQLLDRPDPLAATLTATGCLSVIAARLVHHSEAVPAVMHMREAADRWRASPFVDLAARPFLAAASRGSS
jgi:hypothetical protein